MTQIITKSTKTEREISLTAPKCLQAETLEDLINLIGEELALNKIKSQLTIDFRSHIRSKMESSTDEELNYSDEDITGIDYTDWKPETRTRMSTTEKAAKMLSGMTPDELKAAIAAAGIEL
jgi:hypothetical protein